MSALQIVPCLVLVLLAWAVPAHAQTRMVATVPFDFIVRGKTFPAGNYEVRVSDSADGIAFIDNLKSNEATFAVTIPSAGTDPAGSQAALVFDRIENRYFLAQIWQSRSGGEALLGPFARRRSSRARATAEENTFVLAANQVN
jgi:hypothetical protein